jgi:transposase
VQTSVNICTKAIIWTKEKYFSKISKKAEVNNMPRLAAKAIELSKNEERILEQFAHGTHSPQHLTNRSKIILLAAQGNTNDDIEAKLGITNHTVIKWRNRYYAADEKLAEVERETPLKLKEEIIKTLSDKERAGKPPKFTDEQIATIIAISLQDPETLDFPFSHWSCDLLRIAAINKGIVDSISNSQIRRFLKRKRY